MFTLMMYIPAGKLATVNTAVVAVLEVTVP